MYCTVGAVSIVTTIKHKLVQVLLLNRYAGRRKSFFQKSFHFLNLIYLWCSFFQGPQIEIASCINKNGIEKRANVNFIGKVEYYETGVAKPMSLSGEAISFKPTNESKAQIVNIIKVNIKKRRCYLLPGMQKIHRRVTVRGKEIKDVPTKYTMTGLESYELPVVGKLLIRTIMMKIVKVKATFQYLRVSNMIDIST